jgi:hypothetical protein
MPERDVGIGFGGGVYEIVAAPSNTNHLYMVFNGYVYASTDRGKSWSRCSLAQDPTADPNGNHRTFNKRMAVDPNDETSLIVTTPFKGISFNKSACFGAWTKVPTLAVPTSTGGNGGDAGYLVAFDPRPSPLGRPPGLFIESWGHGVYYSPNYEAGEWSLTKRSPTTGENMITDGPGNVWLVDNPADNTCGGVYKYDGEAWTNSLPVTRCVDAVAVNPNTPSDVFAVDGNGRLFASHDSGQNFSSTIDTTTATSSDIPWLGPQTATYLATAQSLLFDPTHKSRLMTFAGLGVWATTPPATASTKATWDSMTAGIEQLVSNWIASPPGGPAIFAAWDQGIFSGAEAPYYPSSHLGGGGPAAGHYSAWAADWASASPSTIVGLIDWPSSSTSAFDNSGYSLDSGKTWNVCKVSPSAAGAGIRGGSIAASSNKNFVAVGTDNGTGRNMLIYTDDSCATWQAAEFTPAFGDSPPLTGETGWGQNYYYFKHILIADRVNIGTFYAYNYGPYKHPSVAGFWKSIDHGHHWNLALQNSTYANVNAQMRSVPGQAGNFYVVSGVDGLGNPQFPHPTNGRMLECTDDKKLVCTIVPNVAEPWSVGFGHAAPGKSYPTIFLVGWVSQNGGRTYRYGIWQSDDHHATWKKIGMFPGESFDQIVVVDGDNNVYGRAYIGLRGSGVMQLN